MHDSGSRDAAGRNNTTGGILLEEGTTDFRVTSCDFRNVRGNGVWTHSLYTSPRNARGLFADNSFDTIGRDALQVGHAFDVRVEGNTGARIGYPPDIVDATPVAIDTAGNVERSSFTRATVFDDINGKCIDLDGFHDGEVSRNVCCTLVRGYGIVMNNTNPDMQSRNIRVIEQFSRQHALRRHLRDRDGTPDRAQPTVRHQHFALQRKRGSGGMLLHGRRARHASERHLPWEARRASRAGARQFDRG